MHSAVSRSCSVPPRGGSFCPPVGHPPLGTLHRLTRRRSPSPCRATKEEARRKDETQALIAQFLETSFDEFNRNYQKLVSDGNYLTKRQCLKLLADLLARETNAAMRTRYALGNPPGLHGLLACPQNQSSHPSQVPGRRAESHVGDAAASG